MSSLKNKAVNAFTWDFFGGVASKGITFVISIFLARILSPEDFGLVGMTMVFIVISQLFMDVGLSKAIIQREEVSDEMYSSVFVFNLVAGLLIFILIELSAPFIAVFFEIPEVENLIRLLALGIPLNSSIIVQESILKKELRFKELSIRTLIASVISGVVGVSTALMGYGVYALVFQYLVLSAVSVIVLWNVNKWRPTFSYSWSDIRELFNFSKYVFFAQFLGQLLTQFDTLVIAKLFSPTTLGFFSRADSLGQEVTKYSSSSINKITFTLFSKIQKDDERFASLFFKLLKIVAIISFLISGLCILSGEVLIISLFGEKWRESVWIFQILMLRIFNFPINAIIVNMFLAKGKSKENFWHGNVRKGLQLAKLSVAFFFDFETFLYAIVVFSFIGTAYNLTISANLLNVKIKKPFFIVLKVGLVFLLIIFFAMFIKNQFVNIYVQALLSLMVFVPFYLMFIYKIERKIMNELMGMIRLRMGKE